MKVIRNKHFSVHNLRFSGLQLALASSGLMLLLVGLFMVPNFIPDSTHADDDFPPISDPSISIAPAGGINLVMTPNVGSGGSFGTAIANVTVNTSNTTGYTFTMNTETTNTDLINNKIDYTQSGASDYKITNLSSSTTTSNFPLNKWGYNVHKSGTYIKGAANTYVPVPNSSSSDADRQIEITDAAGSNTYSFAYGVKANVNMPAGDYSTTIVFSATANPLPTMQDFDYTACAALSTGDTVSLYDERDNEEYLIGKLADGNCWMLDNLRLDLTNSTVLNSLTTDNTNVDSASLTSLKSGNRSAGARYASSGFAAWNSDNTSSSFNQAKANAAYKDTVPSVTYGAGSGKIGVYYNYCAASAGNYCYDSNAGADKPDTLQDAEYDICPKGWRMPTGGDTTGEYQALYNAYSSDATNFKTALSTPLSGYGNGALSSFQGERGYFWSSTWKSTTSMAHLYITDSTLSPSSSATRNYGRSVRCLIDPSLYKRVASMSKGTQTAADLQAAITVPTSADRTQDTSNSGVYEYNSSVFGASSDASNDYKIYYYRGVLENTVGSYGSDGSAVTYPNYVKLGNTCWRIVRTTGSGGVKMIYNGTYGATTSGSCANTQTNAQVTTQAFGLQGNSAQSTWFSNINRVGYTFNNTQSLQDSTTSTSVDTVFGSDSNPVTNNARSNIKTYIEDTWYPSVIGASSGHDYTNKLEASAGYCNDRSAYSNTTTPTALTSIPPYATSSATMYFGSHTRVTTASNKPTLTCPRNTVDLYRYVANSTGLSNELKYPAALITADEAAFAGSGNGNGYGLSTPFHTKSYLRSGSTFWLLSPYYRNSYGGACGFGLSSGGSLQYDYVANAAGVRPAISLASGTTPASGTGTATDPWIVNP